MKVTSFGAAEGVTGSCHLIEAAGRRILLDCGMFQGGQSAREKNEPPMPFDPTSIDAVVVSHAHLDHIGRIPLLVKEGFEGRIFSNRPTYELSRLSLLDAANIQDYEARRLNRRRKEDEPKILPIYDEGDIFDAVDRWDSHLGYGEWRELFRGIRVRLHDAGHILGSAFVEVELTENGQKQTLLYSGDLGNTNKPIIRDPAPPPRADLVLLESTYGNRDHRSFEDTVLELEESIRAIYESGGNAIIPTFALERAQELIYVLYLAWRDGRIPRDIRIFLDSPMAISATGIFRRHEGYFDEHALELLDGGEDPFNFPAITYTRHSRESFKINSVRSGAIILAGSGMVTGGRVLDHLRHNLGRPECGVVFCGFQAAGTLGRRIIEGANQVTIHGHVIDSRAKIHTINGFSGHAGQSDMTAWVEKTGADRIFLVHGEEDVKDAFAAHLRQTLPGADVGTMAFGHSVDLLGAPTPA
jgi:metallo-beta-lactamase family protein